MKELRHLKQIWSDHQKALTFSKGNSLNDLVRLRKLLAMRREKQIEIKSLKMKGKTHKQIKDIIERLTMLGEVFDPQLMTENEGLCIMVI